MLIARLKCGTLLPCVRMLPAASEQRALLVTTFVRLLQAHTRMGAEWLRKGVSSSCLCADLLPQDSCLELQQLLI